MKEKDRIRARIAEVIIQAQIASDAGKGVYVLSCDTDGRRKAKRKGYPAKDNAILEAIRLICQLREKTFRFSVCRSTDQNNHPCFIVYFNFYIDNKRRQVSFHCFDKRLWKFETKSRKTTWDKKYSSSKTVRTLIRDGKDVSPR